MEWYTDLSAAERAEEGRRLHSLLPSTAPKFTKAQRAAFKAAPRTVAPVGVHQAQRTALAIEAALVGDVERLMQLLRAGIDVDARNGYGQTALFVAVWQRHAAAAARLSEFGAVEVPSASGVDIETLRSAPCVRPAPQLAPLSALRVEVVHRWEPHGRCCFVVDGAFAPPLIERAVAALTGCRSASADADAAAPSRSTDPDRHFFCDEEGWMGDALSAALARAALALSAAGAEAAAAELPRAALPYMRFLHYARLGLDLAPHTDAAKWGLERAAGKSTHTFILFLADCNEGGATCFVDGVQKNAAVLAAVAPRRGRLLLFPHKMPHSGATTVSVPKLLLRGELQ